VSDKKTKPDPAITYAITGESGDCILLGPFYHETLARKAFKVMAPISSNRDDDLDDLRLVQRTLLDVSSPDFSRDEYRRRIADEVAILKLAGDGDATSDAFSDWLCELFSIATIEESLPVDKEA
jgi:hypothetical protein